jgi:hypothetical protein
MLFNIDLDILTIVETSRDEWTSFKNQTEWSYH